MNTEISRIGACKKNKSEQLDLSDLKLKFLPNLPNFIKELKCSNNQITKLPAPKGCGPTRKNAGFITNNLLF